MQQFDEQSLKLLIDLFNESQIPDNVKQQEIHHKINELSKNSEFSYYVVYILAMRDNSALNTVRKIAGATLKGVLERNWDKMTTQTLDYIKITLLQLLDDPDPSIRSTIANVITALFVKVGTKGWPELIKILEMNIENPNQIIVETSLECISKILEDLKMNSENIDLSGDDKFNTFSVLMSKLIFLCEPKIPSKIRELSLHSLNLFVFFLDPTLLSTYLQILMLYSEDQDSILRIKSCEGFIDIYEFRKDFVLNNLEKVIERILKLTMDDNKEVKKVACRFWNEYLLLEKGEPQDRIMVLRKFLNVDFFDSLISVLIECLHYTQEDSFSSNNDASQSRKLHQHNYDNYDEEDDVYDERHTGKWTLREEATRALAYLAVHFKEESFINAQEKIADCLKNPEWIIKESGILCLGALARGAYKAITPHLKDLFPFLIESLGNQYPLVRCTSCWTLSKFSGWIISQGKIDHEILKLYLTEILKRVMDDDPQVQQSSCTALARLVSHEGQSIEGYTNDIIQVFKFVSEQYQNKSLANLYDAISQLACNVAREKIQDPANQSVLLDLLIKKWNSSQFNDFESIYLVECTDAVLTALEDQSANYADFFLGKSLFLIFNYIQARKNGDKKFEFHKKEIAFRSFEMLITFLKTLGPQTERFVSQGDYQLLFNGCIEDPDVVIRQFILSCVGEVAKHCPNLISGFIEPLAQGFMANLVIASIETDPYETLQACCNNTTWSVGEVAIAFPNEFSNYASAFASRFCDIFNSGLVTLPNLTMNLSIAIGRISLVNSDAVAPLLDRFLKFFCKSLNNSFELEQEKHQAFRGLFLAISKNPNGIVPDFVYLCQALVNFDTAEPDLQEIFTKLIVNFKAIAGQLWYSYFDKFPKELQDKMRLKFGV